MKEKAISKNKVSLLALILIFAVIFLGSSGCSMKKFVIRKVANALTGEGSTVFTGDNDPQLVADALPFALKLYESLLEADGENTALLKLQEWRSACTHMLSFSSPPIIFLQPNSTSNERKGRGETALSPCIRIPSDGL